MKHKKPGRLSAAAAAIALGISMALGSLTAFANVEETRYNLKDLACTTSPDNLKVGRGDFCYIGESNGSTAAGDWAEFTFSVDQPGTYEAKVATKKHNSKGIFQTSINGTDTGEAVDQYSLPGADNASVTVDLGPVEIQEAGQQTVRFTIQGKNEQSGSCQLAIAALILEKEVTSEIPDIEFKEPTVSDSGNVIAYAMPHIYQQSSAFHVKADGLEIPVVSYRNEYDYAQFSMNGKEEGAGPVHIEIEGTQNIQSYEISPRKLGIDAHVSGSTLSFDLDNASYLIIQLNGGKRLVIAADKMEIDVPEETGEGIFNVLEDPYKAERTGTLPTTEAIQKAIDDASAYGTATGTRGTVYVPQGVYEVGSLVMKSNMEIYLEGGAVLRATLDKDQYPIRGKKDSIGKYVVQLIYTENNKIADAYDSDFLNEENYIESQNMKIYGRGTVDARGRDFESKNNLLIQSLIPVNCSEFTADGITLRDTNIWSVAPGLSNDLEFLNLKFFNTFNHEDDCIDINNCQNVLVKNAVGIALDDPFSTKTWQTGELFRAWCGQPENNENILFEDCLSWTWCYGFKVGQGSWYDQTGVTFRNGTVYECAVGLGVHHKYGTGTLSDILFENIDIEHVNSENDGHRTWLHMQAITPASEGNLPIENVTMRNINVYDKGRSTAKLVGYDNTYKIQGIHFENIYMDHLKKNAQTLEELDIKDLFSYCTDLTADGQKLPDPQEVTIYQLESDPIKNAAELSENCPALGTGSGFVYIGSAVGDWASFPVEVKAGTYRLEVLMKKHESKGMFQLYVDDEPVGEPYDQYYGGNKEGVVENFGTITFDEEGTHKFKFEIVGKNSSSKGYQLVIDAVKLTAMEPVEEKVPESVKVTKLPEKLEYQTGEEADFTGLEVTLVYSDGSEEILTEDQYQITGFSTEEEGLITITVSYGELTAEFEIEVAAEEEEQRVLESIEITRLPKKTAYYVGEKADFAGLEVTAFYSDGSQDILTEDQVQISGFSTEKAGMITVTVKFEGMTDEFELEVTTLEEEVQKELEKLTEAIDQADDEDSVKEAADKAIDFFSKLEKLTAEVMDTVAKMEKALVKLCKDMGESKVNIDGDVKDLYGISDSGIQAEGLALTAYAETRDVEVASPSNAVLKVKSAEDVEPDLPEEYDPETAVVVELELQICEKDKQEGRVVDLAAPVRITFPMPKGMNKNDNIIVMRSDGMARRSNGGEELDITKTDNSICFTMRDLGIIVIAKEMKEPEKPEVPEKPEIPEKPEEPENPGTPEGPVNPEDPENPETPEEPEKPEDPEKPETPEEPENPEDPEKPDTPEEPEKPEDPEKPETPEEPEKPENPEKPNPPEEPEDPEKPDTPEEPVKPEDPEKPDTPEEPEKPEDPGKPEVPGWQTWPSLSTGSGHRGGSSSSRRTAVNEEAGLSATPVTILTGSIPSTVRTGTWNMTETQAWKLQKEDSTYARNEWGLIDGKWYLFNDDSIMVQGWAQVNGTWYYFNMVSGAMETGWQLVDDKWYYLDPVNGDMKTGRIQADGIWYDMREDGSWIQ